MKKILYLCCLLLTANQTIAAAADTKEIRQNQSLGARLCAFLSFSRPSPRAVTPAAATVDVRSTIFKDVIKDPKDLKDAVKTWRICRSYKKWDFKYPPGIDMFYMHEAEDAARIFITNSINAGMAEETKEWLKIEVLRTDPEMGRTVFYKLY